MAADNVARDAPENVAWGAPEDEEAPENVAWGAPEDEEAEQGMEAAKTLAVAQLDQERVLWVRRKAHSQSGQSLSTYLLAAGHPPSKMAEWHPPSQRYELREPTSRIARVLSFD